MREFLQRRLLRPILQLLTQGVTPEKNRSQPGLWDHARRLSGTGDDYPALPSRCRAFPAQPARRAVRQLSGLSAVVRAAASVCAIGRAIIWSAASRGDPQPDARAGTRWFPAFHECALVNRAASGGGMAAGRSCGNHRALCDLGAGDPAAGSSSSSSQRARGRQFRTFLNTQRRLHLPWPPTAAELRSAWISDGQGRQSPYRPIPTRAGISPAQQNSS